MPMWVYNPHTGGKSIPPAVRARTQRRILDYADQHYAGKFTRIDVRFRGALCYIDAYTECTGRQPSASGRDSRSVARSIAKYAPASLPDSLLRKRRPLEFCLVHLCPRKVPTKLVDHWRGTRHTRRSFRDVGPLPITNPGRNRTHPIR